MSAGHGKPNRLPNTLTQSDIVHQVWVRQDKLNKKQITDLVRLLLEVMRENLLQNKRVQFKDFGTLYLKLLFPAHNQKIPKFKASSIAGSRFRYKPAFNPSTTFFKRIRDNTIPSQEEIDNAIKKNEKKRKTFIKKKN